jgi:hypothetical protein
LPATINIKVDASQVLGEMSHNWNYIGYDEINYTYTPEGQELLAKFMAIQEKPYYIRTHHSQTFALHEGKIKVNFRLPVYGISCLVFFTE